MLKIIAEKEGKTGAYNILGYDGDFERFVNNLSLAGYQKRGELGRLMREHHFQTGEILVMQDFHVEGVYDTLDFAQKFNILARSDKDDFDEYSENDEFDECEDGCCVGDDPAYDSDDDDNKDNDSYSSVDDLLQTLLGVSFSDIEKEFNNRCNDESKEKTKQSFDEYTQRAKDEAELKANQARAFAKQALYSLSKKL